MPPGRKKTASTDKAEKISIALPPDLLISIRGHVQAGRYGSMSELIREAMRLWQQRQEEHEARLDAIRARVEDSASSGESIPLEDAFDQIERRHRERTQPDQ